MLDLDHGTYPFVTSSNPVAGAASVGAGVGPGDIDEVWGIAKAYATRVGAGPFPTELEDELGEQLRERGGEVGTTTGRPRRCGWLDLVALRYAVRLNGMTALAVTKLDVLSGIDPIRVCVRYRHPEGAVFDEFPYHQSIIHTAEPEYEELPGFEGDIGDCRREEDLPQEARDYLEAIADHVGVPVTPGGRRARPRPGDLDGRSDRKAAGFRSGRVAAATDARRPPAVAFDGEAGPPVRLGWRACSSARNTSTATSPPTARRATSGRRAPPSAC